MILDLHGRPIQRNGHARKELVQAFAAARQSRDVRAAYDAARNTVDVAEYWSLADRLDADSSHSKGVRSKIASRARYEVGNNGYADGAIQTYADYLVGCGPTLRMQTRDASLNATVEFAWGQWAKRVQLRRKLWCMAHAKVQDGEAFALLRTNPKIGDPTSLDFVLFEAEQCTTPYLPMLRAGYIDGIKFDEFGNVEWYDVLPYHPGGQFLQVSEKPEQVSPRYVCHWYMLRRPGQHRAVSELRSTLNTGAKARQWRDATLESAKNAAAISMWLSTGMSPDGSENPVAPMSTLEFPVGSVVAAPDGYSAQQIEAKHPNSTFSEFHRSTISEQGRPKSMPYNITACDSSNHSYASGRLDHQPFHVRLNCERHDGNELVLDKVFAEWWRRAVPAYGWDGDALIPPSHSWDWPKHPVADREAESNANDTDLKNGSKCLSEICSEAGQDFEEKVVVMARDYGVSEKEMRSILLRRNFENLNDVKMQVDAYGIAVRAGAITPCLDDENEFRRRMGLPEISEDVRKTWQKDGGSRRPVTLSTPKAIEQESGSDPSDNPDMSDEERKANGGRDAPQR